MANACSVVEHLSAKALGSISSGKLKIKIQFSFSQNKKKKVTEGRTEVEQNESLLSQSVLIL